MKHSGDQWHVYLLSCCDETLYCGITKNLERRLKEHNQGRAGAKYTRARRPVRLVYSREFPDRSSAARFEFQLKQLDRLNKLLLINDNNVTTNPPASLPVITRQTIDTKDLDLLLSAK